MSRLVWDATGERYFETGTDHGVLYPISSSGTYPKGVAWNGLTSVSESPDGAEAEDFWADNIKYGSLRSAEEFGGSINAYTYPDEFAECDGSAEPIKGVRIGQQKRKKFGFSYRTKIGNDVEGDDLGYKLHLVYGATASPSEKEYQTVNDSPEMVEFSWDFDTDPVAVTGYKPTAHLTIDSTDYENSTKLSALEDILYGSESSEPRLPLPDEVLELLATTTSGSTGSDD